MPCLCGDPACRRCFPAGQVLMKCDCGWKGRRYDCDLKDDAFHDLCPECGQDAVEDDQGDEEWR